MTVRGRFEHDSSMKLQNWTRQFAELLFPPRQRILYWKLQHVALRLSTQISPNASPATKSGTATSPNVAPATKTEIPTSPNPVPGAKNDSHDWSCFNKMRCEWCVMADVSDVTDVTWLNCYLTELLLDWTATWLNCYWTLTGLGRYFTITLLTCYFTELLLDWAVAVLLLYWTVIWLSCYWTVTLQNCYLTELLPYCYSTELLFDWAVTELLLYWTVTWLSCYFTAFFACLNLRNSEVSHLNFLWWRMILWNKPENLAWNSSPRNGWSTTVWCRRECKWYVVDGLQCRS